MKTVLAIYVAIIGTFMSWWTAYMFRKPATMPMVADPKLRFCRNCRWALPSRDNSFLGAFGVRDNWQYARCSHPTSMRESAEYLVGGVLHETNMHYCSVMRKSEYEMTGYKLLESTITTPPSCCGSQGRYWEPRTGV